MSLFHPLPYYALSQMAGTTHRRVPDASRHHYRPLSKERKEIRLLTVEAGNQSEILSACLRHATLDKDILPHYETISYCWGKTASKGWLFLDGYTVSFPAQAIAALKRMRFDDKPRTLWIDAICIDQSNFDERSAQVSIMDQIYGMSAGNLIYLGNDERGIAQAIVPSLMKFESWIQQENQQLPPEERLERNPAYDWVVPDLWKSRVMVPKDLLLEILPLFGLSWFR